MSMRIYLSPYAALESMLGQIQTAKGLDRGLFCDTLIALDEANLLSERDFYEFFNRNRSEDDAWTDAALALLRKLLPKWTLELTIGRCGNRDTAWASLTEPRSRTIHGDAVPGAGLAILSALLAALIAQVENPDAA